MKTFTLVTIVCLIVGTSGFLIKVPTVPTRPKTSPVGYVHLQKLILPLFENVCEDSTDPIIVRLAQEFTLDSTTAYYSNPEVNTNLKNVISKGLLPKGQIFTDYDIDHIEQLKIIYEALFYAKDFDTFYKTAAWARQNINCGLFVRAIYLAIISRRDTERLSVPAPYELLPNYFIQKDIIVKASSLLSGGEVILSENVHDVGNSYILDANYTSNLFDNDNESKLAYFYEDIGLNTYYFLQKIKRSPWFNTTPVTSINYGEYLYHIMKQLAARYNLERYANDLPGVDCVDMTSFTADSYDPMLIYSNGNDFGYRTRTLEIASTNSADMLKTIENSIATVVTHMRDTGYNKTEILNHLMGILVTGERSFETTLRNLLGKDGTFAVSQPSVLDHYLTSLRDPVYWKINQKIIDIVDNALEELPAYTRNELYFPGVEILNIDVKKVMTNFDYFQFDVTDALNTDMNTAFQLKIGQPRLNHKPFVVKLNVSSLVTQKGIIKIFLGPKVAPGELVLKKNKFMLLDSFECDLKIGSNIISRSSDEIQNLSDDFTSLRTFRKYVEDAEFGLNVAPLKTVNSLIGFPQRLILPKGTPEGLPLQLFTIVAPFVKSTFNGMFSIPNIEFNSAILSPGFPLDLAINDVQLLNIPNVIVKDIIITHKGDKVANYGGNGITKKWSKGDYDPEARGSYGPTSYDSYAPSSRPNYSAQTKEPFDYSAKKEQFGRKESIYGKKPDYASNKEYNNQPKNTIINDENDNFIDIDKTESSHNAKDESTKEVHFNKEVHFKENNLEENTKSRKTEMEEDNKVLTTEDLGSEYSAFTPIFTRKPTVYDYIINPGDYYDPFENRVYE